MIRIDDENGHGQFYYTGNEVAKALKLQDENNKVIGRNKFYKLLRDNDILMDNNMPYQRFITLDLVTVHQVRKGNYTVNMVLFTGKGLNYIKNKFNPHYEDELVNEFEKLEQEDCRNTHLEEELQECLNERVPDTASWKLPPRRSDALMSLPENHHESPCNVYYEYLVKKDIPELDIFLDVCIDFFNEYDNVEEMERLWMKMVDVDYQPTYEIFKRHMKEMMEKL